jgi:hypothetical protein
MNSNKVKTPLFFRKKNLIITATEPGKLAGGTVEHCKSINEAKRKSVALQKANGGVGCGILQVVR